VDKSCLSFIDHIQKRLQQILNCAIQPRHSNKHSFKSIGGFKSVGIGPLCLDDKYVETNTNYENLKGELKFIEEKMNFRFPPMPTGTKEQKQIYNKFIKSYQSYSAPQ